MLWERNLITFFKRLNFSSLTEMNMAELMLVILLIQLYRKFIYKRPGYSCLFMTPKDMDI